MKREFKLSAQHQNRRQKRKGIAAVYVALSMPIIIGITAYCIDVSWLYSQQAKAQRAADAAALAGAWQLANFHSADAEGQARYYAALRPNGSYGALTDGSASKTGVGFDGSTVVTTNPVYDKEQNLWRPNWYQVTVRRPEPTFFAGIFGAQFRRINVGAIAVARFETLGEFDINGGGAYGKAGNIVNLSLFGPDGNYNNGDCYSVKKLPNGKDNPLYTGRGYDFTIKLSDTFKRNSMAYVQIYDPDCYNASGANVNGTKALDEYRGSGEGTTTAADATTTQYTLYWDNGTTYDTSDDTLLGQKSYGNISSTDLLWNDFYSGNPAGLQSGNLRLNVLSTAGGSENGFNLRVSEKPVMSAADQKLGRDNFTATNGTIITAQGHIPMNFNSTGTVTISLGTIPIQAASGQLVIRKFDTDVNAKSIVYKCSTLPGMSWTGTLASNGTFASDTISVPASYTNEGVWTATYAAGLGDTSVWDMSYSNAGPGKPGGIKLIK